MSPCCDTIWKQKGSPPARALLAVMAKSSPDSITATAAAANRHPVNHCPRRVYATRVWLRTTPLRVDDQRVGCEADNAVNTQRRGLVKCARMVD